MIVKMKKISKRIILLAMALGIILLPISRVKAALQANGGEIKTLNLDSWILPIRKMQEVGGTLGRTDAINTENFTSNATDLDIHLQKNTEYGAMAILSASAYGNPNKINAGETTTGNSTGVVISGQSEYTASNMINTVEGVIPNYTKLSPRYRDKYKYTEDGYNVAWKNGDATDIYTWHGGTIGGYASWNTFIRYSGSIFGFASGAQSSSNIFIFPYAARAAIVVGSDL